LSTLPISRYVQDAERNGDDELAEFFRRAQGESRKGAEQAKQMLAAVVKLIELMPLGWRPGQPGRHPSRRIGQETRTPGARPRKPPSALARTLGFR
jgi:hypothetical protein